MTETLEKLWAYITKLAYQTDFETYLQAQRFINTADVERAVFEYMYGRRGGL